MKASDLPEDVKKHLLRQMRDQIGSAGYDRMVNALGEDGLIDIALQNTMEHASSSGSRSRTGESPWIKAGGVVLWILVNGGFWVPIAIYGSAGPLIGTVINLGLLLLLFFSVAFFHWVGALEAISTGLTWIICGIAVIGGIAGLGYGIWKAGPWLVGGVHQWWGWLGGHF